MENEYSTFMDLLLEKTMSVNATDLHICAGSKPLMRVNSKLIEVPESKKMMPDDINKIVKIYLDDNKYKILIEKKVVDFSYSKNQLGRFRCNIYRQRGTYAIAIRTLPLEIPQFKQLGLPDVLKSFVKKTKGLILISGATGSGKSTTLASMIDLINKTYNYHIITIEDPVEYLHKHNKSMVTQREVGDDALSFSDALRSALREDPDVIMVGEMRDIETIRIALTAAETGHLVLSTLHTSGAVKSIDRIIDAFPNVQQNQIKSQLSTVLEGVVSQQLLPKKNENGMILASEVLVINPAIRNLIREGKHYQINSLIQTGSINGMKSLERNLASLCKEDKILEDDARLKAQDIKLFNEYMALS